MPKYRGPTCTDNIYLPMPGALSAFLKVHSFRRDVTVQDLARCVLTCWVRRATPRDDPIFAIHSVGYYLPPPIDEREYYPGFIESLRFLPEDPAMFPSVNEPPARTNAELWPSQRE